MDANTLATLLNSHEGPALEFKRSWYAIDSSDVEARNRSRDELTKDILALANGGPSTAGDVAFLVIGAADHVDADGTREIYDAVDFETTGLARRILQLVSAACSPALGDITFDVVHVDSKRVGVLTIHPTPHLHETTRPLRAATSQYSERTAFMRAGDTVRIASSEDRDSIRQHKRHRFKEYGRVSPVWYGAVLGMVLGAMSGATFAKEATVSLGGRLAYAAVGLVVFGLFGLTVGWSVRQYLDILRDWYRAPRIVRWAFSAAFAALGVWLLIAFYQQIRG